MNDIEKAVEVIGNRRADSNLVRKAMTLLKDDIPNIFTEQPLIPICLAPHVAGGTRAELQFAQEASESEAAVPVWTTYVADKFTTRNPAKVNHWRPKIAWPKGQITRQWIVPQIVRSQGNIGVGTAATTFSNEAGEVSVQDYQAGLAKLALACTNSTLELIAVDYSEWYARQSAYREEARSAKGYYPAIMALYSVFGVLFRYDNQPGNEDVLQFRQTITVPAAEYSREKLGVTPVIVARDYPSEGEITDLRNITEACPEIIASWQRARVRDGYVSQ